MVQPGMESVPAKGLSLWLMPDGEARERLAVWICQLAARLGTAPFSPHLTLASAVDVDEPQALAGSARAAAALVPFTVALADVEGRDEHFRCLFVRARDESTLRTAHATAARILGREPDPDFLPHVSLVYGALTPAEKGAIAREVGGDLGVLFEVRRLHLWRTEGPVSWWRELGVFELGGPSGQAVRARKRRATRRS